MAAEHPDRNGRCQSLQRLAMVSLVIGLAILAGILISQIRTSAAGPAPTRPGAVSGRPVASGPVGGYLLAIDRVMSGSSPLNRNIRYLAIDAESLAGRDEKARTLIFENLEQYGLIILDKGREELETEGYIENMTFTEGVFIDIKVRKMGAQTLILDAALYRSGAGAYGWRGMTLVNRVGRWEIAQDGAYFVA